MSFGKGEQQKLLSFETVCYRRVMRIHGQPGVEMETFWKKQVEESYGVQLLLENSDTSDTL